MALAVPDNIFATKKPTSSGNKIRMKEAAPAKKAPKIIKNL